MDDQEIGQEKTESPTEERRELFRKRGEVAHSREVTSVLVLGVVTVLLGFYSIEIYKNLTKLMQQTFSLSYATKLNLENFPIYMHSIWMLLLKLILPFFAASALIA